MIYAQVPNDFSYVDVYAHAIANASRGTKEFYFRAGKAANLPYFLKFLNYYLLLNDKAIYLPSVERITRSTGLNYYFSNLTRLTRVEAEGEQYNLPLLYNTLQREAFNFKDVCAIHLIEIVGQIQDTFERAIPDWARTAEATEQLGISLALKLTPKHRIRVYTRGDHIIVFTTKGMANDVYENDYKLYRKLWACLPLLRGWINSEGECDCADIITLCKSLDRDDSAEFWTLLEHYYATNETLRELKYSNIIQTFNNISVTRQNKLTNIITEHSRSAESYLQNYAQALERKRTAERELLELQNSDTSLDTETIKMLVDKKICYDLDIAALSTSNETISYRCAAPLLSYDKDAARTVYNRRVKDNFCQPLPEIYKLLFIDEKVVLLFTQAIDISLARGTIHAREGDTRLRTDHTIYFPNPHHYEYNCWGSYGPVITKLIHEAKLEEIFYQVKAAVGSLNFSDPPVISCFLTMLERITEGDYDPACFLWRDENCTTAHTLAETIQHFREETTE